MRGKNVLDNFSTAILATHIDVVLARPLLKPQLLLT